MMEEEEAQMESLILNDDTNGDPLSNGGHPLSPPAEIPTSHDHTVNDPLSVTSPNPNSSFNSFLEPPSYADAVFRSFDDGHNHNSNNNNKIVSTSSSSSATSSSGEYLKISVTDPRKSEDVVGNSLGGGGYVTYLIATWTNLPEFNGTEFSVRRRFKDVVTLSDRLSEAYRGYFIPLRPDKSVVESQVMQKHEFVENRRVALEKYLRKLAEHPVIKRSEELRVFLQVQGKLPLVKTTDVASRMLDGAVKLPKQLFGESVVSAAVDPSEVVQPAKGGRDLLRLFKELRQSVTNDWGGAKPLVVEEDKEFLDKRKKLQDFETGLTNVSQQGGLIMDNNYTLRDLREIAKQRKIKGYTKYRKSELAKLLGINDIEGKGKLTRGETQTPPKILPLPEVTRTLTLKSKKQHGMKQTTRNWLDLPSDLMANILSRVGVIEILWNVQLVCTEWHKICKDPNVWRSIYIDSDYSNHRPYTWPSWLPISAGSTKAAVEMCKQAVDRSQGQLVDITLVYVCDDEILQYIADRSSKLRRLEIFSEIGGLTTALKKLPLLEELSLYGGTLLREYIEALGCYCPMLKTLKLNRTDSNYILEGSELAMAIVKNLPELRHLELTWHSLKDSCLRAILDGCCHLQVLDLRMCEPVRLKGELRKRCLKQIKSLKLPTDPLKLYPYSDRHRTIDLVSYNRACGCESDDNSTEDESD